MLVKNKYELEAVKKAGRALAEVLLELAEITKAGASSVEIDAKAKELIEKKGAKPAFLGYRPQGASRPFPSTICFSVNDEVVHGVANEQEKILKEGDIVTIDCGLWYDGFCVDAARTIAIGNTSDTAIKLMSATELALERQIKKARPGISVAELGKEVDRVNEEYGFYSPRILGGHGVGRAVHEDPFVPNYFEPVLHKNKIRAGEMLALEPILIAERDEPILHSDGYTYKSKNGALAAHFEDTIVVLQDKTEIITRI